MSLIYLSNFQRQIQIPLINWKAELKRKQKKYYVLCAAGADNSNANPNNIIFTIKDTKLYFPFVALSIRDKQKLSKLLSKGFQRSVYQNGYKIKNENKNTTNKYRYFLESNFVEVNRFFILVYANEDENSRRYKGSRYY